MTATASVYPTACEHCGDDESFPLLIVLINDATVPECICRSCYRDADEHPSSPDIEVIGHTDGTIVD